MFVRPPVKRLNEYFGAAATNNEPSVQPNVQSPLKSGSVPCCRPPRPAASYHSQMSTGAIPMLNSAVRLRLDNSQSNAIRETNTDVNRLVVSPITSVAANPFTAGVPK